MSNVDTLASLAKAIALNSLRQNNCGLSFVFNRRRVRCINFLRIMSSSIEPPNIVIRHVCYELRKFRVFSEKMLSNICSAFSLVVLVVTIESFLHTLKENSIFISAQQRVPETTPNNFQNVPAGPSKPSF